MRRAAELLVEEDDQQPQSSITDPGSIQPRTVAERRAQGLDPAEGGGDRAQT